MSTYQLSCGHWHTSPAFYEVGGVYLCPDHGRAEIIGKVSAAGFIPLPGEEQ